jgi:hypothetical protein
VRDRHGPDAHRSAANGVLLSASDNLEIEGTGDVDSVAPSWAG